ncbi:unnamed protein product [Rhizophagus irregularis]|uniref:Uncharacterized protein n=1 Tax=Rhizophagus irregularis TaxID=588596 RepID=A0A915Z539_9GLOM|nr:unnamed protein product [Rhizophagus irregularis]CAB5180388.1 unnamed protein product [Rhizophagus irregularis]CAB5363062.1 unnamed protein product [Rhizophagus irregularis]
MKVSLLLGKTSFSDAFPVNACDDSIVDVDKLKIRDSRFLFGMRKKTRYETVYKETLIMRNIHIVQVPAAAESGRF